MERIYGIEYEEIFSEPYILWRLFIRNPFKMDSKWLVGINEKLIREAQKRGVKQFLLVIGQRETEIAVPDTKGLKEKDKKEEFEWKASLFQGSPDYKIYHFKLGV